MLTRIGDLHPLNILTGVHPSLVSSLSFTLYSIVPCRSTSTSHTSQASSTKQGLLTLEYVFPKSNDVAPSESSSLIPSTFSLFNLSQEIYHIFLHSHHHLSLIKCGPPFSEATLNSWSKLRCSVHRPIRFAITLPNTLAAVHTQQSLAIKVLSFLHPVLRC